MLNSKPGTLENLIQQIEAANWPEITEAMHQHGYAIIPALLSDNQCEELKESYDSSHLYRKEVDMARYRFGQGQYKYFEYPLPTLIQTLRISIYPYLAPIANAWFRVLNLDRQFPPSHEKLLQECHVNNQIKATVLILKYGEGGYNTLHQDLYGDVYFPIQMVLFLSQPNEDFSGGEFVLTQQTPRAQSKAIVLNPKKGDALIFTTNFKPVKGTKGYYRSNVKHGVSEVHSGERFTLGIIFHDALS